MARYLYELPDEPESDFFGDDSTQTEEIATHRRQSHPKGRRILVSLLGVTLIAGIGIAVVAREFRSQPTAAQSREDDRASRDHSRLDAPLAPTTTADVTATPSLIPGPSVSPAPAPPALTARPKPSTATRPATTTSTTRPATTTTTPATTPAGQRTIQAFITGYSYFDNTPPGSADISNPVLHQTAGGTGTYADPITVAVGHTISGGQDILDWPKGTRFYIPNLRRYFIVEDTCGDGSTPQNGPCHTGYPSPATTWLDIWIGGQGGSASGSDACMNAITDTWTVLVNPASTYATVAGSVYGSAGCTRQYGNTVVTG